MALVATCIPTQACGGGDGAGCNVNVDETGVVIESLTFDAASRPSPPCFANVDVNETFEDGGKQNVAFDEIIRYDAFEGLETHGKEHPVIEEEDLQWLGCKTVSDEEGPKLRIEMGNRVKVFEEHFTFGEILKNTNPCSDSTLANLCKPCPELQARRFRLDDIIDIECEVLDGVFDGDEKKDLASVRIAQGLRNLNSHAIKFLQDEHVDWQQVRLLLHRRAYLLRKASSHNIDVPESQASESFRRFSKDRVATHANHVMEMTQSKFQSGLPNGQTKEPNKGEKKRACTGVNCDWL